MTVLYTGRGFEPSAAIKETIEEKLQKIKKYLGESIEVHVIFTVEKYRHTAEIILQGRSFSTTCAETCDDMMTSVQRMMDKAERQTHKHRTKMLDRKRKGVMKGREGMEGLVEGELGDSSEAAGETGRETQAGSRPVMREEAHNVESMTLEEAVLQLEISGRDFFVFRETGTTLVNVLFWHSDGNLGLIELKT